MYNGITLYIQIKDVSRYLIVGTMCAKYANKKGKEKKGEGIMAKDIRLTARVDQTTIDKLEQIIKEAPGIKTKSAALEYAIDFSIDDLIRRKKALEDFDKQHDTVKVFKKKIKGIKNMSMVG